MSSAAAPNETPPPSAGSEAAVSGPKRCSTCGANYPDDYALCPRDATPLSRENQRGDPLLGQILGETYEVTRMIAEGGMGRVYEARHVRLGRRFAVKLLHAHFLGDQESTIRFRREATAAAAIESPHVAQVVDVHATRDGRPYIVSELLDGEELAAVLKRDGAMEISRAVAIARQVCAGLAVAHAAGVVHRDLKPENIMLMRASGGRELAKVVDFGIAKTLTDSASLTKTGVLLGTPAYMAPEQARSSAGLDHRVDIYALGAVLYRTVTGRPAFTGDDPTATLTSVLYDEPTRARSIRKDLPDGLELVIQRAMAKVPDARFGSMLEFDAALAPFDSSTHAETPVLGEIHSDGIPQKPHDLERAATMALARPAAALAAAHASGTRARRARPRAVAYALVVIVWTLLAIASLVAAVVRALNPRALQPMESVLAMVLAVVIAVPVAIAMIRDVWRGAWRNTAAMLLRAELLARVAGWSFGTYALVSVGWRALEAVIYRFDGAPRWVDVAALGAGTLAAAIVGAHQGARLKGSGG